MGKVRTRTCEACDERCDDVIFDRGMGLHACGLCRDDWRAQEAQADAEYEESLAYLADAGDE